MESYPRVPAELLPSDGRFGSGPSRIRRAQIDALARPLIMGTSHRKQPVKALVASIRAGIRELYGLPEGYEVVLGNGGATAFWDAAAACLVRERAALATFGEFGEKFAKEIDRAPHLAPALRVTAAPGSLALLTGGERSADGGRPDAFAHPHHETSTGVLSPVRRLGDEGDLTLIDATSIAGAVPIDPAQADAYYFSPQKAFGSDGGLWVSIMSPAAIERAEELSTAPGRWVPAFLDLSAAVRNSVKDQTLNTPAIATLVLLAEQIDWMLHMGGLSAMEARARAASRVLYDWADASSVARPFVADPGHRSPVVVTIEFDEAIDAGALSAALRSQGVVDIDPYRGVGGNQLRIATWPSTAIEDVEALVACFDWIIERVL
ncbi:phosphoserine transaminase [Schaalia hyovaginalis]|uniref:phosphoserine transaminase n=1 Tax=Schaalia hyovaginalis TaxID=29316 RepID=UPI002A7ED5E8|nr:phosphoserine transaminase [Schaalia hyovaginalis]MDY4492650.1 phosphoserine transaminase [Schaalia hyovaginalis]